MLNRIILIGRLVKDIELRQSASQVSFAYFTLAVNREGNRDKTDFIPCVAFRNTAELMAKYLGKGSLISIEGRLEVYNSEQNGNYETRVNVVANSVNFLDSRNKNQNNVSDSNEINFDSRSQKMELSQDSINDDSSSNEDFDFDNFEIKI